MTLFKWSRTASSNATADSTINWAEGQAPSSINDSARAEMAAVAKYRDDIAGAITTGGTSTAYTVSSYQGYDTLANMDGKVIAFTPHATNGATVTLNVDGLGAKPLRSAPSVELPAGTLVAGTPYIATYNNSSAVWYLQSFYGNPYNVPIGSGMMWFGSSAPNSNFVFPYGQAVSRTTYATLFGIVSTTYGTGDGTTTFNLPDLRGRVTAFLDNMGGSAASRLTTIGSGTTLGGAGGAETHTLDTTQIPAHTHANTLSESPHSHNLAGNVAASGAATNATGVSGSTGTQISATQSATTGITITNASAGGGGSHNNLQPTILVNCVMRII
jgi:microcystin-dependent protein